jgi:arylformamidase
MRRTFLKCSARLALYGVAAAGRLAIVPLAGMAISHTASGSGLSEEDSAPKLDSLTARGPFELPPGARVDRDLAYGPSSRERLDVYIPAAAHAAPAILMVHGGGWHRGNKDLWRVVKNKVIHWVGKGYVFISTNYPMLPQADPLTQAKEVAKALAFVESHLQSWGGDPSRLVLMGHSAGAHLVALLTAAPTIAARAGARPWLASVCLDSAAMNVGEIMRAPHFRLYDRAFGEDPHYWREVSPVDRVQGRSAAPVLLVCSTRRGDSCPQSRAFAAKIEHFGGRAQVLPVDLSHAEINDLLGAPNPYTRAVDAFLHSLGLP